MQKRTFDANLTMAKRTQAQMGMVAQFVLLVLIAPKESANCESDSIVGKNSVHEVYCHIVSC